MLTEDAAPYMAAHATDIIASMASWLVTVNFVLIDWHD